MNVHQLTRLVEPIPQKLIEQYLLRLVHTSADSAVDSCISAET